MTAIEWEVCVNVEPYFETTPYWTDVFDATEIVAQRALRADCVQRDVSVNHYEAVKAMQGSEFRWRFATGLAWLPTDLLPQSLQLIAANIDQHPSVSTLTRRARGGRLPRPQGLIENSAKVISRQQPKWVTLLAGDK